MEPSSGPMRNYGRATGSSTSVAATPDAADGGSDGHSSNADSAGPSTVFRGQAQAPVKSACTFCRSRKSRCNGKQPCAACISRGRVDDCIYTISRRGGKPKPKGEQQEPLEAHLEKLLGLSELPHLVRIPNVVPQLQAFQDPSNNFQPFPNMDPSQMFAAMPSPMGSIGGQTPQMSQGIPQYGAAPQFQQPFSPLDSASSHITTPQAGGRARSLSLNNTIPSTPARALLGDYYRLLYRFVAVLPGPQYLDVVADNLQPNSPLMYALKCVIAVITDRTTLPQSQLNESDHKTAVRSEAQYYAKLAYEAIDEALETAESQQEKNDFIILEVIQALSLVVIYEYGSARALKSRLKVDAALTLAMSKGLHRLSPAQHNVDSKGNTAAMAIQPRHYLQLVPDDELYETKKRVWWTLWALAMWTAYNTGRIPTVRADDPRVTCELPASSDTRLWSRVISSLQGLLLVQDRVLALAHIEHGRAPGEGNFIMPGVRLPSSLPVFGPDRLSRQQSSDSGFGTEVPTQFTGAPTIGSRADVLQSMAELDAALQEQMKELERSTSDIVVPASYHAGQDSGRNPHDDLERFLQFVWATQVYTTSLTLHIGQAFQGATLFERKLCFLSTISDANDAAACQMPMPNAFEGTGGGNMPMAMAPEQDMYARGPFAPRESLQRCVDASDKLLLITRNLRQTEAGFIVSPNPFNACSFVLVSFVCLMQALAISSNTDDSAPSGIAPPSSGSGVDWNAAFANGTMSANPESNTPSLLKSAQNAAVFTPAALNTGDAAGYSFDLDQDSLMGGQDHDVIGNSASAEGFPPDGSRLSRQEQLQRIWSRVKEAKDALQDLSRYWDMAIPMSEEVSGCLEASQFLLSQQNPSSVFSV